MSMSDETTTTPRVICQHDYIAPCRECRPPYPSAANAALRAENARLREQFIGYMRWRQCERHAEQTIAEAVKASMAALPWAGPKCERCNEDDLAAMIAGNPEATRLASRLKESGDMNMRLVIENRRLRDRVAALEGEMARAADQIMQDVLDSEPGDPNHFNVVIIDLDDLDVILSNALRGAAVALTEADERKGGER